MLLVGPGEAVALDVATVDHGGRHRVAAGDQLARGGGKTRHGDREQAGASTLCRLRPEVLGDAPCAATKDARRGHRSPVESGSGA